MQTQDELETCRRLYGKYIEINQEIKVARTRKKQLEAQLDVPERRMRALETEERALQSEISKPCLPATPDLLGLLLRRGRRKAPLSEGARQNSENVQAAICEARKVDLRRRLNVVQSELDFIGRDRDKIRSELADANWKLENLEAIRATYDQQSKRNKCDFSNGRP